ncbi:MAG: YutD family protein [Bacilli bacterium]|nr:YutD family protein [Bacilli bacterium]
MKIVINDITYEVVKNEKDAIDEELLKEKITDYFDSFDYIFGDWAYGKVRLKGFNDKKNKGYKLINDYRNIDKYLKDNCAYGCRYFILKKIEKK